MTAKEKAKDLIRKFESLAYGYAEARQCALICVDEMQDLLVSRKEIHISRKWDYMFLDDVRKEILKGSDIPKLKR